MCLKKFFAAQSESTNDNDSDQILPENLDFNAKPKITGPVTRTMKKLMDHKNAAQLAINVLCDLSKNIVPCASGNKSVQTIHYYLILFLHVNTSKNAKRG